MGEFTSDGTPVHCREPYRHTFTQSLFTQCMFLDSGRKLENPEETQADMGYTWKTPHRTRSLKSQPKLWNKKKKNVDPGAERW